MGVGVDAGDEDVGVMDTGPDEGQADGLGEVDVEAAGHGTGDARAAVGDKPDNCFVGAGSAAVISVRPGPCLRKSGGEEGFGDFRTDLEAVRTAGPTWKLSGPMPGPITARMSFG